MKKLLPVLMLAALLIAGCRKQTNCNTHAVIIDGGPLAGDGCDWMVLIDSVNYHPQNLGSQWKQNNRQVMVNYHLTSDTFHCGWAVQLPVIAIDCIED